MAKAYGSSRVVLPSKLGHTAAASEFNSSMSSGGYDAKRSYLPPNGSGYLLYQNGHKYHIEEVEVGKALADKGYKVVLRPEGIEAYATAYTKDGTPKYAEGTISSILYDQKTVGLDMKNAVNNVNNAIKHAREKGANIALIYDRNGLMHRNYISAGMAEYKRHNSVSDIKAVLVMDKNKNLYEHHF